MIHLRNYLKFSFFWRFVFLKAATHRVSQPVSDGKRWCLHRLKVTLLDLSLLSVNSQTKRKAMVSVLTQTEKIDWGERRSNIRSWTEDNIPNLKFQSEPPGQKVTEKKNSAK